MPAERTTRRWLDIALFFIVTLFLVAVGAMLSWNIYTQYVNYAVAIDSALSGKRTIDHSAVIAYSRAWDFAIVKTSSLFISVIIILIGSLYVLRSAESHFKIASQSDWFKGTFSTSSPGLAIILMGVVLAAFSLNYKSDVGYKSTATRTFEETPADLVAPREHSGTMEVDEQ